MDHQSAASSIYPENYDYEIFLPKSLVNLIMKIAKSHQITNIDEFSMLDTFQSCISRKQIFEQLMDQESVTKLVVNIIQLSEKINNAHSQVSKLNLSSVFPGLSSSFSDELQTFKSLDFKIESPALLEMVYEIIQKSPFKAYNQVMTFAIDVLRFVYLERSRIYEM